MRENESKLTLCLLLAGYISVLKLLFQIKKLISENSFFKK